jgi:hypothetical protein
VFSLPCEFLSVINGLNGVCLLFFSVIVSHSVREDCISIPFKPSRTPIRNVISPTSTTRRPERGLETISSASRRSFRRGHVQRWRVVLVYSTSLEREDGLPLGRLVHSETYLNLGVVCANTPLEGTSRARKGPIGYFHRVHNGCCTRDMLSPFTRVSPSLFLPPTRYP